MLLVAEHEAGDADAARLGERLAQQRISAISAPLDRLRLFHGRGLEVVFREHDEVAFLDLVALDELVPGDRPAVADADALELHG